MGKILHQLRWLMSQVSWSFLHQGWCRISSINSQGNSKTIFYVCCHTPSIRGLPWILLKVVFHSQKYWRYLRPNSWLIPYLENLRSCSFNYCMLCLTPLWDGTCKNLWIWIKSTFPWHKYFNGIDSGTWMGLYSHDGDLAAHVITSMSTFPIFQRSINTVCAFSNKGHIPSQWRAFADKGTVVSGAAWPRLLWMACAAVKHQIPGHVTKGLTPCIAGISRTVIKPHGHLWGHNSQSKVPHSERFPKYETFNPMKTNMTMEKKNNLKIYFLKNGDFPANRGS